VTARIYAEEAELYDIAFGWDVAEADWLVERLGPDCRTVLEPGCGTGRMLAALAERGLRVTRIGDGLALHLDAMARHLEPGARYLVQQGLVGDTADLWRSEWEAERGEVKLHVLFEAIGRDPALPRERSRSRVDVLSGPREGEVVEDLHATTYWTPETWRAAIDASPFRQTACYEGARPDRPAVELGSGGYLWHELVAP
jgi:hypothetical protein